MELLDLLEQRVSALVTDMEVLRKENDKLREEASVGLAVLAEENAYLKHALEEEQQIKGAVLKRIDGLLQRLKDVAGEPS